MTYESGKQLLTTFGGDHAHSNPLAVLVAGGLCGIVSWAMICMWSHHFLLNKDVMEYRLTFCLKKKDPIDSAKSIYQRNALMYSKGQKVKPVKVEFFKKHMYRGLGVSMGRSCAVNAIFFSSFEFWKKHINALPDDT